VLGVGVFTTPFGVVLRSEALSGLLKRDALRLRTHTRRCSLLNQFLLIEAPQRRFLVVGGGFVYILEKGNIGTLSVIGQVGCLSWPGQRSSQQDHHSASVSGCLTICL